jgi:hypothetical protein
VKAPVFTAEEIEVAYQKATATMEAAENLTEAQPHLDFRTAVRRVLGTSEWRSDPDRINAAEAKRQRKQKRNTQNRRP